MGKRGPKPVSMGGLNSWEFEFYKAFHLLRDGVELPGPQWARPEIARLSPTERDDLSVQIQKLSLNDYAEMMESEYRKSFRALERSLQEFSFEQWKNRALRELAELKPRLIPQRHERRAVWSALVKARMVPGLKEICEQWKRTVHGSGFPAWLYVLENANTFFAMKGKRARRFPRSAYADDSRIDYLARGMAGVLMNVSPQTAIERLRNMKHSPAGPLWRKEPGGLEYCACWRCRLNQLQKYMEAIGFIDLKKGGKKK